MLVPPQALAPAAGSFRQPGGPLDAEASDKGRYKAMPWPEPQGMSAAPQLSIGGPRRSVAELFSTGGRPSVAGARLSVNGQRPIAEAAQQSRAVLSLLDELSAEVASLSRDALLDDAEAVGIKLSEYLEGWEIRLHSRLHLTISAASFTASEAEVEELIERVMEAARAQSMSITGAFSASIASIAASRSPQESALGEGATE